MTGAAAIDLTGRLERTGALLGGHFQLSSGLHSNRYIQCAKLLSHPRDAEAAGAALAEALVETLGGKPDVVIGPALGGVIIAHEVARALDVPCFFAERKDGEMTMRRGFALEPGQKTVIVEDVVTTGGSVKEVVEVVTAQGASVEAIGSIVCRRPESPFDQPYVALLTLQVEAWEPEGCPMCAEGSPAVKPGSRPGA